MLTDASTLLAIRITLVRFEHRPTTFAETFSASSVF
jgi:hypothetical protein